MLKLDPAVAVREKAQWLGASRTISTPSPTVAALEFLLPQKGRLGMRQEQENEDALKLSKSLMCHLSVPGALTFVKA